MEQITINKLIIFMNINKNKGFVQYETKNEAFDEQLFYAFHKNLIQVCKDINFKNRIYNG